MGVKGQSNPAIARTPRNAFRCSLANDRTGGRALKGLGPFMVLNPIKLRIPVPQYAGVRLRVIRSVVERERAQIIG